MSKLDEINKLNNLLKGGFLTQAEFDKLKQQILGTYVNEANTTSVAKESVEIMPEKSMDLVAKETATKVLESRSENEYKETVISQANNTAQPQSTRSNRRFERYTLEQGEKSNSNRNLLFALSAALLVIVASIFLLSYFNTPKIKDGGIELKGTKDSISNVIITQISPTQSQQTNLPSTNNNYHKIDVFKSAINAYYGAMNNSNFNASDYFSSSVTQYIRLRNTNPIEINNTYEKSKSDFINSHSDLVDNTLNWERTENGIDHYTFKINFSSYRKSLGKQETCLITVEVGYDSKVNKLSSYSEMKIEDLKFEKSNVQTSFGGSLSSKNGNNLSNDNAPESVDVNPEFPGGDVALMNLLMQNIRYPEMDRDNYIQGKVIVTFDVLENGSVSNPRISKSVSRGLDAEALRVVRLLPKFKPATKAGEPYKVQYNLPVVFKLN